MRHRSSVRAVLHRQQDSCRIVRRSRFSCDMLGMFADVGMALAWHAACKHAGTLHLNPEDCHPCSALTRRVPCVAAPARRRLAIAAAARPAWPARPNPSRSAWSPRCRASRRWPARPSRAACRSPSTRSTPRAACSAGASSSWCAATTKANPAKGVIAARELIFREKVAVLFGGLDTPVSMAIVPLDQPGEGALHGPLGRRHRHHQERRQPQLRLPRLGGGRDRRHRHAGLRAEDLQVRQARA